MKKIGLSVFALVLLVFTCGVFGQEASSGGEGGGSAISVPDLPQILMPPETSPPAPVGEKGGGKIPPIQLPAAPETQIGVKYFVKNDPAARLHPGGRIVGKVIAFDTPSAFRLDKFAVQIEGGAGLVKRVVLKSDRTKVSSAPVSGNTTIIPMEKMIPAGITAFTFLLELRDFNPEAFPSSAITVDIVWFTPNGVSFTSSSHEQPVRIAIGPAPSVSRFVSLIPMKRQLAAGIQNQELASFTIPGSGGQVATWTMAFKADTVGFNWANVQGAVLSVDSATNHRLYYPDGYDTDRHAFRSEGNTTTLQFRGVEIDPSPCRVVLRGGAEGQPAGNRNQYLTVWADMDDWSIVSNGVMFTPEASFGINAGPLGSFGTAEVFTSALSIEAKGIPLLIAGSANDMPVMQVSLTATGHYAVNVGKLVISVRNQGAQIQNLRLYDGNTLIATAAPIFTRCLQGFRLGPLRVCPQGACENSSRRRVPILDHPRRYLRIRRRLGRVSRCRGPFRSGSLSRSRRRRQFRSHLSSSVRFSVQWVRKRIVCWSHRPSICFVKKQSWAVFFCLFYCERPERPALVRRDDWAQCIGTGGARSSAAKNPLICAKSALQRTPCALGAGFFTMPIIITASTTQEEVKKVKKGESFKGLPFLK